MGLLTDTSVVSPAVSNFFDRKLLKRALPMLCFMRVSQRRPLSQRNGNTIVFRRIAALPFAIAALTEGVPPGGRQISKSDVTATIQQWGDYVTLTDMVKATVEHPILNDTNRVLGEQAAQTIDILMRNEANAGTQVLYGGGVLARTSLLNRTHMISTAVLDRAIRFLQQQNAGMFTRMIRASTQIATFPIRAAYWCIVHPDIWYTLQHLPGVIPLEQYAGSSETLEMEVGNYKNIRFLMTTLQGGGANGGALPNAGGAIAGADVQANAAAPTLADVYISTLFATEAIASVPLDGMSLQNIIKPLGSAGSADPLNQLCTSGWKHTGTRKRLNENFMIRIETTAGKNEP